MRFDALVHDLAISVRMLRRAPAFALTVIATIALGIGATTLVLAVFDTVVLHVVPFREIDRLVSIYARSRPFPDARVPLTLDEVAMLRARGVSFSGLATYAYGDNLTLTGAGEIERLRSLRVSTDFFTTLGGPPALVGRTFDAHDADPGNDNGVILSYDVWQRHFAGDPHAVGRTIALDGKPHVVVGVMPPQFDFPAGQPQVWLTQTMTAQAMARGERNQWIIARLRPGVGIAALAAEVRALANGRTLRNGERPDDFRFEAMSLRDSILGGTTRILWMLFAAVLFVLLTASANVAGLLILRSASRQRETAVRRALGAGALDIVRRFVTESVILSVIGSAFGVLLATWGARVLRSVGPTTVPRLRQVDVDSSIVVIALAVCLLVALIVTLVPAIRAIAADLSTALRVGASSSQAGFGLLRGNRSQHLLALCQIAIVVIFVAGFGLFARSLTSLLSIDPGFDPHNLLSVALLGRGMQDAEIARVGEAVRALPGVESAAFTDMPLETGGGMATSLAPERASGERRPIQMVSFRSVDPPYFATMRIPIVKGRAFAETDSAQSPCVAIVSESLARVGWPGEDPIGRRVDLNVPIGGQPYAGPPAYCEVVGVVHDVRDASLNQTAGPRIYYPLAQRVLSTNRTLLVRTRENAAASVAAIVHEVHRVSPFVDLMFIAPLAELVDRYLIEPRFYTVLFGMFAGLATMLAAVGVYGISAYAASRRTREIGIRLVLGARRGQIVGLVVRGGAIVTAIGILAGMLAAAALSRFLASLLFEVRPLDPVTFMVTPLIVALVAIVACYLPARRAARLDPGVVLRVE